MPSESSQSNRASRSMRDASRPTEGRALRNACLSLGFGSGLGVGVGVRVRVRVRVRILSIRIRIKG